MCNINTACLSLFIANAIAGTFADMSTNKPPGPPRKAAADRKRFRVAFRVTEAELQAIESMAAADHLSVSEFARSCALAEQGQLRPTTPGKVQATVDAKAVAELNRVGVNLYQVMKMLRFGHTSGPDLTDTIAEVRAAVAKLAGPD